MTGGRIVVAGGGLAGMAAAIICADRGARVTLLEKAPRLGGATWSFRRRGVWYDNGQHVFLRCCTYYRQFLDRLGVGDRVALQDRLDVPVLAPGGSPGRIFRVRWPAPLHLLPALAGYRPLTPRERAGALRAVLALRRLQLDDPALDLQTFGAWLGHHGQRAASVASLWDLIALPTLNLPSDEASLALAAKVFRTGLLDSPDGADIGYPMVPLSALHADPAARVMDAIGVDVRTSVGMDGIEADGPALSVRAGGDVLPGDAVVVAVPHEAAGRLLGTAGLGDPDRFRRLGSSPIVNLHVHYDRRVFDRELAAVVGSPVQWLFDRTRQSGVGHGQVVAVSLSGATEHIGARPERLEAVFLAELARILPAAGRATVLDFVVTRSPRATFRQGPGTRSLRPRARTAVPGLVVAGAWTDTGWPATMEGAVRSGVAAAREALIHIGSTRDLPAEVAA